MPTEIDVGVGIVVSLDGRRVLACQRRLTDYWGGWWEFPGGKREANETIQECVRREVLEEVGLDANPVEPLPSFDHLYADRDRLVHVHPWLCRLTRHQDAVAAEVECFAWCTPSELLTLKFLPANDGLLRLLVMRLSQE